MEKIEVLVEGGKATAAPPLGPKLGEMQMNVGEVISQINDKTKGFQGMKVPVTVEIGKNKEFTISVGTPPTSQLIKKELGLEKGSGEPNKLHVHNVAIEQVIKIAKMKESSIFGKNLKSAVKCIAGSLNSMGVMIEGKEARKTIEDINKGVYDKEINEGKTNISEEKKKKIGEVLKQLKVEAKKLEEEKKAEEEAAEKTEEAEKEEVKEEEKKEE